MFRVVWAITAFTHATFALAAIGAARALRVPHPELVGVALAVALFLPFEGRAARLMPDRPRSRWALHLLDEPYFAHWSAALGAAVPIAVASIVAPVVELALGRPPALPFRFALGAYGVALALAVWGVFVRRRWVEVHEVEVKVAGLPSAFDGYRVAQLSDLHIGGLTPRAWGEAWARRANAHAPDLVAVTGDLVTSGVAFHEDIALVVGMLEAKDGVFVAMGNHDYFGEGEPLVHRLHASGARVLRNEGIVLERDGAQVYLAAIDDTWTRRANLERALAEREPGLFTMLLAHDPAVFLEAVAAGAHLVLSGHTHGGQIAMPFFPRRASLATLTHTHFLGLYEEAGAWLYVHAGLGTTGPPVRLGVAPEIAILTLRAA